MDTMTSRWWLLNGLVGSIGGRSVAMPDYLDSHNAARKQVGMANMSWDNTLAVYTQSYANQQVGNCSLVHFNGPYNENFAKGTNTFIGTYTVSIGCNCLHYTQMVWRNLVRVGCARVRCNNGWWYIVCNYNPPGNYE
ncbi:hypothetical protein EUGRSUZ_D01562 [Eucalyptus grandis]|uniref:Uncharacterized protein n=2 Tax=Eucalyptus grandis TaxID=71139 RepID=A0ACC3L676_EUCGR|nr:hypothetical protein EUGRSUZ_D01562 [Eucalyptus grandis]